MTLVPGSPGSDPRLPGPLDPQVAIAMLQRGQQLAQDGEWSAAEAHFRRVVGNTDPNLHVAALLGVAECRYRQDDEAAALQAWITATQAPETPLTWRAWKQLAAARVQERDLPGAARAYREAEKRCPPEERAEIASRLGWLNKEMGNTGTSERYFKRSRSGGTPDPIVTWSIIGITVAIGLAALLMPDVDNWTYQNLSLWKFGVSQGEYWRLLSVVLVHGGIVHLGLNMYFLFVMGPIVEALYGHARFLLIYLLCGLGGSAASYMVSRADVSVGASGAIFGLTGVLLVADRVHKPALTRNARNLTAQIGGLIAVNLVFGFMMPGIDNAAHIGGLVAGALIGFVMIPSGPTLNSFWTGAGSSRAQVLMGRVGWLLATVIVVAIVAVMVVIIGPLAIL
jgi:membrane associated rhomboid family serine protease